MKAFHFLHPPGVSIEISQSSLKVLDADSGLELPLEREETGRLTSSCTERLTRRLREFLHRQSWQPRRRAWCAISARGVSLRRLTLPPSSREEFQRLLLFQIESEFPLPPDDLAWGFRQLNAECLPQNGAPAGRELLLVAVKRQVVEEYWQILVGCGVSPIFTLGALARSSLCLRPPQSYAVLDVGRDHSELICFDNGVPSSIRILPWGAEKITAAIEERLAGSRDEAEKLQTQWEQQFSPDPEHAQKIQAAIRSELDALAALLQSNGTGKKLYLSGEGAGLRDLAPWLAAALGDGVECEQMEFMPGPGRSTATLGLQKVGGKNGEPPPLILQVKRARNGEAVPPSDLLKWVALAALLVVGSLSLRYAEAIFFKPHLSKKIAEIKTYRERLPQIDRELAFLRYLKANQPPYLDAIAIIAGAAPGTRIESLSINRRGELSLRGSMRDSQQVLDFRSKLIDSGFFSSVTVEEQTPAGDRQNVAVRIAAQLKASGDRKPLSPEPARPERERANNPANEIPSGALTNQGKSSRKELGTPAAHP